MKANKKAKTPSSFKTIFFNFLKRNYIYIIMIMLVVVRLWLGKAMGGWFGLSETYDDVAMMKGLDPKRFVQPDHLTLIKDLSFSVFLGFSAVTDLPFSVILSGYWALSAFIVWLLAGQITKNEWVRLASFAYVLFLPIAFTSWGGLRIYRNAVIAPSIILTFSLLLLSLINIIREVKIKRAVLVSIAAGIMFAFSYYLKEDGIWMMACLLLLLLVEVVILIKKIWGHKRNWNFKKITSWGIVCFIPLLIWFMWTNVYKGVNHAFFGVYEINTRTEGELGRFVEEIYKIDSPNRTEYVWAPLDAIEAAFEASPTLGSYPKLLEEIKTTGFQPGGLEENPIGRDFLTWIMRSELVDSGLWTTEQDVNKLFRQINAELEDAFSNGTLKQSENRIQLLASTGGYTLEEIKNSDLVEQIWYSLEDSLWFNRYDIGFSEADVAYGTQRGITDDTKVNRVLHMENDLNIVDKTGRQEAKSIVGVIMWIYRIANVALIIIAIGSYIYCVVMLIKNRKRCSNYIATHKVFMACAMASLLFLGITLAYSFATAWFFINPAGTQVTNASFVFYRVGVPGILTMSLLSTLVGLSQQERCDS